MWPWGHLAAGYLLYSAYCRFVGGRTPPGVPALVAAVGTQAPDLVDKPLAWTVSVLPSGRSLGHSLVVAALALPVAWRAAERWDARPLVAAFGAGYVMHLLTDALYPLLTGEVAHLRFLAWPLVPVPADEVDVGVLAYFATLEATPLLAFEFLLVALASVAWHADGHPGLATVRSWSGRLLAAVRT